MPVVQLPVQINRHTSARLVRVLMASCGVRRKVVKCADTRHSDKIRTTNRGVTANASDLQPLYGIKIIGSRVGGDLYPVSKKIQRVINSTTHTNRQVLISV